MRFHKKQNRYTHPSETMGSKSTAAAAAESTTNQTKKFRNQLSLLNMKYIQDVNTRGAFSQAQVVHAGERSPASVLGRPQLACWRKFHLRSSSPSNRRN